MMPAARILLHKGPKDGVPIDNDGLASVSKVSCDFGLVGIRISGLHIAQRMGFQELATTPVLRLMTPKPVGTKKQVVVGRR